jgi:DNA-binding transcriptional LysR family regulator
MHIENFKIFSDLVESQSFSRAAKLNGVTQSAVSQQLRSMERHFNVLIVDRSQKQFRLTREGHKLYDSAKEILHRYEKLISELQEMRKVISGTIHISTIYSIGLHELPPYITTFLKEFPSVNVRVEYRRSNLVYEDILQNAVDLGLVAYPLQDAATGDHPLPGRPSGSGVQPGASLRRARVDRCQGDWRTKSSSASTRTSRPARRPTRFSAMRSSNSNRSWSSTTSRP